MKRNIVIVGLLVVAVLAVIGIKNGKHAEMEEGSSGCANGVCTLSVSQEKMAPAENKPTAAPVEKPLPKLLDLGASKCIPCKMMAPILDEMKETFAGQLDVKFIDVWENQQAGAEYGIRMIPTQIFYDAEGRELFRHEGFFAREDMLAKWKELGFEFETKE